MCSPPNYCRGVRGGGGSRTVCCVVGRSGCAWSALAWASSHRFPLSLYCTHAASLFPDICFSTTGDSLVDLVGLVLDNASVAGESQELQQCLGLWRRVQEDGGTGESNTRPPGWMGG